MNLMGSWSHLRFLLKGDGCDNSEPAELYELETTEAGRVRTTFHVASTFFPFIVGAKGTTRRRLENETKTQIRIPRQNQKGSIVITGESANGVRAARRRINLIVSGARLKQSFTHFFTIPMTSPNIREGFLKFKEIVLDCHNARGIEPSIFQNPDKLHLTLATMVLSDEVERNHAAQVLQKCNEEVVRPIVGYDPLKLRMRGVEYMNDDPAEVDVLFGKVEVVDGSPILQSLADGIVDYFSSAGLLQKQYSQVKLHVTLMNTLFRHSSEDTPECEVPKNKLKSRETFNATEILKAFEDFEFGVQVVNTIHLSQRYTTSSSGYYKSTAVIEF
ncbi:activating signal cointegrator 1 complex subunit 1 isoform X2 [Bacillus rossius redtenbacheri]|uniref:activating signal cointegrator 1 complex subunit 1 isoform X2 n=1 Tax=Bacillus rossius redtenbacheri TaxID=93214 RepID=UPI002FDD02C0